MLYVNEKENGIDIRLIETGAGCSLLLLVIIFKEDTETKLFPSQTLAKRATFTGLDPQLVQISIAPLTSKELYQFTPAEDLVQSFFIALKCSPKISEYLPSLESLSTDLISF